MTILQTYIVTAELYANIFDVTVVTFILVAVVFC